MDSPRVTVQAESDVYSYVPADNGAGPMWCSGSTCLVRTRDRLFASGIETLPQVKPYNNVRWMLFELLQGGWKLQHRDEKDRTREPCPMVCFHDGRVLLSVNPTLAGPDDHGGPAEPAILQFSADDMPAGYETIAPGWQGTPPFTEHSYRSFAADGQRGEMILLQNTGYTHAEWAFCDGQGDWSAQGQLVWPWGAEYDTPQPIRVCYPNVSLNRHSVHFCGVSDIVEPYAKWRQFKRELTGREWDYDFRRLFYTWSDDITTGVFHDWVEIASRDETCGWIFPGDLWVAPDGAAHILWVERAIDERLRPTFFPDARQKHSLNYAIVSEGKVVHTQALCELEEGQTGPSPNKGRFHSTPDGRLYVVYIAAGAGGTLNYVVEIGSDRTVGPATQIPLQAPFRSFFTATVRGGSPESDAVEMLGEAGPPHTIRYARVRLD